MALQIDSKYLAAHSEWVFKYFSYTQPEKTGPNLSCIKDIYVTFLGKSTQYLLCSVFGMVPFFLHTFHFPFPHFIYSFLLMCDTQGFELINLCQKNYLLIYIYIH